jgi:hypothetical protein
MFLYDLHNAYDAWYFAVGVIEESQVALSHSSHVVSCWLLIRSTTSSSEQGKSTLATSIPDTWDIED